MQCDVLFCVFDVHVDDAALAGLKSANSRINPYLMVTGKYISCMTFQDVKRLQQAARMIHSGSLDFRSLEFYGTPKRSWVSSPVLLYQGNQ